MSIYTATFLLLLHSYSVSCFDRVVAAGHRCFSQSNCSIDEISEALLQCSHGMCVCNPLKSHFIYKYSDVYNQVGIACQNRSLGRICLGIYHNDNSCACSPGKVAFKLDRKNGNCVEDDTTHQGFGEYCSAVMTACDASLGLTCRNSHCFCAQDSHYYNLTQQRCVRKSSHLLGHNQPCFEADNECQDRFICFNGKCQCEQSCGPYMDAERICACEKNQGWRLVLLKVVPMVCLVLVLLIIAGAIFMVSSRWKCRRSLCPTSPSRSTLDPHQQVEESTTPLNSTGGTANDSYLNASAPPLYDLDFDDAPPPYEEAIKDSVGR